MSGERLADVDSLAGAYADRGETRHEVALRRVRGAESQNEVQDVEELQRDLLRGARERFDEIDLRRGLGAGSPRKAESGCTR